MGVTDVKGSNPHVITSAESEEEHESLLSESGLLYKQVQSNTDRRKECTTIPKLLLCAQLFLLICFWSLFNQKQQLCDRTEKLELTSDSSSKEEIKKSFISIAEAEFEKEVDEGKIDFDEALADIIGEQEYELEGEDLLPAESNENLTNANGIIEKYAEEARKGNLISGICGSFSSDARDHVALQSTHNEFQSHVNASQLDNHMKELAKVDIWEFDDNPHIFVHIPKTGGTSVIQDGVKTLNKHHGGERSFPTLNRTGAHMLGFFREPRAHVFSQFLHCKYNPYHTKRNYKGFQRTTKDEAGDAKDFEAWLDHFLNPSFHIVKHKSSQKNNTVWNCYLPYNMQARYMTSHCRTTIQCHEGTERDVLEPSLVDAIANLEKLEWFGITEYYKESLCLLFYHNKGVLPPMCQCNNPNVSTNLQHLSHRIHPHDVKRLDLRTKRKIDQLTRIDSLLYRHAKDILEARLLELERVTKKKVLCH